MILTITDVVAREVGDDWRTTYQMRLKNEPEVGVDVVTSEADLSISWNLVGDVSTANLFFVAAQAATVAAAMRAIHFANRDGRELVGIEFTVEGLDDIIHD